ncbi:hypothetical protein [Hymenobacter metallilatus]|uniref:Uncharacterized protein n=1 Tax=Hymenobacter metallilatus TaxID=2493666 RepID=A0A428IYH1_9BACT|nr:hypothetical protein [Hymenobacter metallilatus]RSK24178.1 hypothetical protein EI290_20575 [Hymenobacter metallilatus]
MVLLFGVQLPAWCRRLPALLGRPVQIDEYVLLPDAPRNEWFTIAGLRWATHPRNVLRLRGIRTTSGEVLLSLNRYQNGERHGITLGTVPAGSYLRVRLNQYRDGHTCLSVYRQGSLLACLWHEAPPSRPAVLLGL